MDVVESTQTESESNELDKTEGRSFNSVHSQFEHAARNNSTTER